MEIILNNVYINNFAKPYLPLLSDLPYVLHIRYTKMTGFELRTPLLSEATALPTEPQPLTVQSINVSLNYIHGIEPRSWKPKKLSLFCCSFDASLKILGQH